MDILNMLYPEIAVAGDYVEVLRNEILRSAHKAKHGVAEAVNGTTTFYANASQNDRSVNTTAAAKSRLFIADFWDKGVQVGSLSSNGSATIAAAILAFLADRISATELARSISEFTPTERAATHEIGAMAEVLFQWDAVKVTIEEVAPGLLPLANTLSQTWPFSHLFPTLSLEALCFSRCTGVPYSADCPSVVWLSPSQYEVRTQGGNTAVGVGDEATVLALLNAALPPDCGPAVQGSAGNCDFLS